MHTYTHIQNRLTPHEACFPPRSPQALARTQGIFTGISGGAAMAAAVAVAERAPEGSAPWPGCQWMSMTGRQHEPTPFKDMPSWLHGFCFKLSDRAEGV